MRTPLLVLALAVAGCVGVASEPNETRGLESPPTPPREDAGSDLDAGLVMTSDAGTGDAGEAVDAGADAGLASDAGVDAGSGVQFDGGAFPISNGPFHGTAPTVTDGPIFLAPTQGVFDDTCALVWNPLAHELLMTVCQVNAIWRYRPGVTVNQGFDVVRPGGEGVFGMQGLAVLPDGALVVAETVSHQLTISRQGYASPQPFATGTFNMPLHVIARRDGNVYFTDPRTESGGGSAPFTAVYRVSPQGQLTTHFQDLGARGLALSYDQRTLYLSAENRYGEALLYKVALDEDGTVGASTLFAGAPDGGVGAYGLCVDQADNVYHAARGGIRVYAPSGSIIGTINVPGADDCAFGDDDAKSIYVTTSSSLAVHNLYRVRVDVPGLY